MSDERGKIRVGVIGTGHQGRHHVRIFSEMAERGVELAGICDVNEETARALANTHGTTFYKDYRDLAGVVDAVSIVVPTILHHPITRFFLDRSIHCLVEKPITATLAEAEELLKISKDRDLVLLVGHVERFNRAIQKISEIVKKPRYIEVNRLGPFSPRVKDIGVVQDLMIHDIDIILNLVKDRIARIEAVGLNVMTQHEDIAHAHIIFDNGCIANLNASRLSNESTRKLRLFQEDLYLSLDYVKQEVIIQKLQEGKVIREALPISKEEPLKLELYDFISCVIEKKSPMVSGKQGMDALGAVLEILKNIHNRRQKWTMEDQGGS